MPKSSFSSHEQRMACVEHRLSEATIKMSALRLGISEATLRRWLKRWPRVPTPPSCPSHIPAPAAATLTPKESGQVGTVVAPSRGPFILPQAWTVTMADPSASRRPCDEEIARLREANATYQRTIAALLRELHASC